jgi:glycine betaine/proline transport system ATP-binding protein
MPHNIEFAVEVDNLWKVFTPIKSFQFNESDVDKYIAGGAVAAVRDISLRIKRGEVFVIMGLSGSEKSITTNLLSAAVLSGPAVLLPRY